MSQFFHFTPLTSPQRMFDRDRDQDKTILVGNLHSCVTEEILFELFLQAGPVDEVRIFREGQYGCVHYKHAEAVPYALALLNGIWLYGQPIRLRQRTDGCYHRNEAFAYHTGTGLIADSADAVVLNVNSSPAVESHSNEACGWRDMVYGRRLDACFCPALQWSAYSGLRSMHENASLHSRLSCASVEYKLQRELHRGCPL